MFTLPKILSTAFHRPMKTFMERKTEGQFLLASTQRFLFANEIRWHEDCDFVIIFQRYHYFIKQSYNGYYRLYQ